MEIRTRESASNERVGTDGESRSVRRLVTDALGNEQFVAGFHRVTEGTPRHPETHRVRYDNLGDLPTAPRDDDPVWEELVVYSTSHVYRWKGSLFDADPTRLPRSPGDVQRQG
ncbi:hypothetical protein ACFR9U_11135 [Halorientalis brevis]|uniref:Uncharacterized protein n=1 Tax=Halorientalis brevis TaxID=1126241 RepID=A0ABD6CBN3_9EURY|nr:hypothetical protein [Halorientalis brevis]